ncbi:hypothetical protein MWU52_04945 [Jannaschia sp. S6380]|uniref:head-tail connector protein n=1 Tax=Jannaschia sp. S6380 TaxID=2926408 RepID=UPI001FF58FE5|nr:hypothetical protein [Jannaschia sp. S6380]MCK0166893.1 hypothetical protein [Jannaschia sp. S6380]
MTVIDSEGIADEMLPLAELAAQMRLADGFEVVPGQADRLRLRLRAGIEAVERRLGRALIAREFLLSGEVLGGRRVPLPIAPVEAVLSAAISRAGALFALDAATVEAGARGTEAVLARAVSDGEVLQLRVRAGYGVWSDVPGPLRQAALLLAEALDMGGDAEARRMAEAMMAPFRPLRIGGAR